MVQRFLTVADVTEILNISTHQAYALIQSGELRALQIGGTGKSGQWRVEADELEDYIQRMYARAQERLGLGASAHDGQ